VIFQTLDDKKNCYAFYDGKNFIYENELPENFSKTWSYSGILKNKNVEIAQLYCSGKKLTDICPESFKDELDLINKKMHAIHNSCIQSKVDLRKNCFFDLAPKHILQNYCDIKNKISDYVFKNYDRPLEYDFYKRFTELLNDIKYRDLNIDFDLLKSKSYKESYKVFINKINNSSKYINYNLFGSITGRLTVKKDSFPILTFPKQYRQILIPKNDWFISFDINAAEIRTALALLNIEQPKGDLHEWSVNNIYNKELSRSEAKETTTSWLYNSNSKFSIKYDKSLSSFIDKQKIKNIYWINGYINTPYNRKLEADEHHSISYLNQSTFIDLFHRQIIKIDDFLQNKKSFISFLIHDELVLDVAEEEKNIIIDLIKILQNTPYGNFPVNIKAGKSFGEMKKLNLKVE
jgi:hypothetical protein